MLLALTQIECELHRIAPRSPNINPIENVFHLVKKMLQKEAIDQNITKESFDAFKTCFASTHLKSKQLTKQLRACQKGLKKLDFQKEKDRNTNDISFDRTNYV